MSGTITGELRLFLADPYRQWMPQEKQEQELKDALDAIDAVHANLERENASLKAELDRVLGEQEDRDEWVRLPVDADGVPIRVGDVMDSRVDYLFDGKPFTVRALVLCEDGWEVADGRFGNRYELDSLRHHHEPTVEDVLREFVDEMNQNLGMYTGEDIDADEWRSADNKTIAEYAAKLRLAGDAS